MTLSYWNYLLYFFWLSEMMAPFNRAWAQLTLVANIHSQGISATRAKFSPCHSQNHSHSLANSFATLVAQVIRNAIRANQFARIICNWNPHFYSGSGQFGRITRISDSRESPDLRESCESIRANHATKFATLHLQRYLETPGHCICKLFWVCIQKDSQEDWVAKFC